MIKEIENVQNSIKICTAMQENTNLNRLERQEKIANITKDTLSSKLSDNVIAIDTDIYFNFDQESISSV